MLCAEVFIDNVIKGASPIFLLTNFGGPIELQGGNTVKIPKFDRNTKFQHERKFGFPPLKS